MSVVDMACDVLEEVIAEAGALVNDWIDEGLDEAGFFEKIALNAKLLDSEKASGLAVDSPTKVEVGTAI